MTRYLACGKQLLGSASVAFMVLMSQPAAAGAAATPPQPKASLLQIQSLAAEAYIWGLAAEFTWRFAKYNTTISAPINALTYGSTPAAWNNAATNAGNPAVIYINGFMDFSTGEELVLTVPPSKHQYYVVNYLDSFINTIGSIGTRTTPSDSHNSYLLVGPDSKYAHQKYARIAGKSFPVMASDTNLNWMLIRIATSTLADGAAPNSITSVYDRVSKKFALNTLKEFRENGNKPVYPADYANPSPTDQEILEAAPYKDTPTSARKFFDQLGQSLILSPIPPVTATLGGTPIGQLPSWVVPQYGAKKLYSPPSNGQAETLRRFAPIGLSEKGYSMPANWGQSERAALQKGYEQGQKFLNDAIASQTASSSTNYWTILNDLIGTYPNTVEGYLIRSTIVLNGGSANIPLDAVYPNMTTYNGVNTLDGNETYKITFTPPVDDAPLPVNGTYPPQVTDRQGRMKGFWAVTVYQPDSSEVSAPFLPQSAVLNNAYSNASIEVMAINSAEDTITVLKPDWGKLSASTPIIFAGRRSSACGLNTASSNAVYYVASNPVAGVDLSSGKTTYTFKVSSSWLQDVSDENVPIQYSGQAGSTADLLCDSAVGIRYGMLKPVSQLGSSELENGKLKKNPDGSLTLWLAPSLPAGVPATNWLPTPSTDYYDSVYGADSNLSTQIQVILRTYYPTPGDEPPSILPYEQGGMPQSYIPPAIVRVD